MNITQANRKVFLQSNTYAFQSGFLAAEDLHADKPIDTFPCSLNISATDREQWDAGYKACMNNSFTAEGQSVSAL